MTTFRMVKNKRYFVAANEPFNDDDLTWEATGMIGYLLSKPDGWEVRTSDLIKRKKGSGRDRTQRIINELKTACYMRRFREKGSDGRFKWVTEVYESKELNPDYLKTIHAISGHGSPVHGKGVDIVKTDKINTNDHNKTICQCGLNEIELGQHLCSECKTAVSQPNPYSNEPSTIADKNGRIATTNGAYPELPQTAVPQQEPQTPNEDPAQDEEDYSDFGNGLNLIRDLVGGTFPHKSRTNKWDIEWIEPLKEMFELVDDDYEQFTKFARQAHQNLKNAHYNMSTAKSLIVTYCGLVEANSGTNQRPSLDKDQLLTEFQGLVSTYGRPSKSLAIHNASFNLVPIIQAMGGWYTICDMKINDLKFAFYKAFKSIDDKSVLVKEVQSG